MKFAWIHDHRKGVAEWQKRKLDIWMMDMFEVPRLKQGIRSTVALTRHVGDKFDEAGWTLGKILDPEYRTSVFAMKDDLAFELVTSEGGQAAHALLKFQYLYSRKKLKAAAIAVPARFGTRGFKRHTTAAGRLEKELMLFEEVITAPIMLVAYSF